jgi:hypothetical protein
MLLRIVVFLKVSILASLVFPQVIIKKEKITELKISRKMKVERKKNLLQKMKENRRKTVEKDLKSTKKKANQLKKENKQ